MSQVTTSPGAPDPASVAAVAAHTKHTGGQQDPPALASVAHAESHSGNQNPKWTGS